MEAIGTFVTSVTVSQGSRINMEYISIGRVTSLAYPPMSVTKVTKVPQQGTTALLMPSDPIVANTFVTRQRDRSMTEVTEGPSQAGAAGCLRDR